MASSSSLAPPARVVAADAGDAPSIRALSAETVNRIAAGEVIQRPASALKELLENSIDARANKVAVMLKEGGMAQMQIQDNGCGIRVSDYPILCERFTTSKLSDYTDLQSISTFGFRGEALASMTHVSRVCITSMTRDSPCAYRAWFHDGRMIDPSNPSAGGDVQPKPSAGVKGTTILIEDLFYNVPIRRAALQNAHNEEYAKCLDVLCKYAVHYAGRVAISCKKAGSNKLDLNTAVGASHVDNVRAIYGAGVAKELLPLDLQLSESECGARGIDGSSLRVSGLVSNANFSQKKLTFLLFINDRLVESSSLRRAIDGVYAKLLPKHSHPFVYLSLSLAPSILDVNVHPTKREVHFLHEEQIVAAVEEAMDKTLKGANKSRVFYTQSILAGQGAPALLPQPTAALSAGATGSTDLASLLSSVRGVSRPLSVSDESKMADVEMKEPTPAAAPLLAPMDELDDEQLIPPTVGAAAAASASANFVAASSSPTTPAPRLSQSSIAPSFRTSPPAASQASSASAGLFSALRSSTGGAPSSSQQPRRDDRLVRTDNRQGRLDAFLTQPSQTSQLSGSPSSSRKRTHEQTEEKDGVEASASAPGVTSASKTRRPKPPNILLTSVQNLLASLSAQSHPTLSDLFASSTYVGFVDHSFSLVQHGTKLYLVNLERLSTAYLYERVLRWFGHHACVRFQKPLPIRRLIRMALEHAEERAAARPPPTGAAADAYAAELSDLLLSRAAMLQEYFALELSDDDGEAILRGIPELIEQYNPPLLRLPLFLLRLARDCNWNAEQECFDSVARCLAQFYTFQRPELYLPQASTQAGSSEHAASSAPAVASGSTPSASASVAAPLPPLSWLVPNVFYPLLRHRNIFSPPAAAATDGTVTQVASLENLYKIFERC